MASVVTLIIEKNIHEKNIQKKIISDLPTLIFSRYETGTTGFFLRLVAIIRKLGMIGMQLPEKYKENFDVSSEGSLLGS